MHYRIARRHGGHFKRVHPPSYGGRYGLLRGFAAASPKAVWAFGARQIPHDIQDLPAIWRLSGKKWVRAKLPAMQNGVAAVTSMSASSPTNAWAVGSLYALQPGVQYALHWNGKKWVGVPEPAPFTEVSTLGPKDAWAVAQTSIYHWDGATWSLVTTAASNVIFNDIAMSSPRLGYAVGAASTDELTVYTPVMMRFNGKKWTKVSLKRFPHKMSLTKVAVHGKSAWTLGVTSTNHALILHTSGGAPKAQQTLGRLFRMAAISAASTKHAYAVGTYGYKHARSYFEALHGNHWKAQSSNF
jgi:hypothetical protein